MFYLNKISNIHLTFQVPQSYCWGGGRGVVGWVVAEIVGLGGGVCIACRWHCGGDGGWSREVSIWCRLGGIACRGIGWSWWKNRTEQNLVAWTLGVIACRWDTEQITPKSETLKCPLVRGRHSVYLWLQESKNSRGHLPYTGGSAMPALCLTEKRTQLSREPIPWLYLLLVWKIKLYINHTCSNRQILAEMIIWLFSFSIID